jgi:hypothetical protein
MNNPNNTNPNPNPVVTLNQRVIEEACKIGCKLLGSETILTPNAWNNALNSLEGLLVGILQGRYAVVPNNPNPNPVSHQPSVQFPRDPTPEE